VTVISGVPRVLAWQLSQVKVIIIPRGAKWRARRRAYDGRQPRSVSSPHTF